MKVKELIQKLSELDPESYVFTKGYEGGFQDIDINLPQKDVYLNVHEEWWYGPHDSHPPINKKNQLLVKAVIL
jgi:hypothetical protein